MYLLRILLAPARSACWLYKSRVVIFSDCYLLVACFVFLPENWIGPLHSIDLNQIFVPFFKILLRIFFYLQLRPIPNQISNFDPIWLSENSNSKFCAGFSHKFVTQAENWVTQEFNYSVQNDFSEFIAHSFIISFIYFILCVCVCVLNELSFDYWISFLKLDPLKLWILKSSPVILCTALKIQWFLLRRQIVLKERAELALGLCKPTVKVSHIFFRWFWNWIFNAKNLWMLCCMESRHSYCQYF